MGLIAEIRGVVAQYLSQAQTSGVGDDADIRLMPQGEVIAFPIMHKQHGLLSEGSYFVTNNAQTGIATPAVASWGATTPMAIIQNTASTGGNSIYLDYMRLVTTAAGSWGSAGVNLQAMVYVDLIARYSSGGTNLTSSVVSPNGGVSKSSVAQVYFGNITALAAGGQVRAIVGLEILRPAVSATVADVIGEKKLFNFGGVEATMNGSITIANANAIPIPLPAIAIGPGGSALIYFVMNGTSPAAASYAPEFGWWERP